MKVEVDHMLKDLKKRNIIEDSHSGYGRDAAEPQRQEVFLKPGPR